MDLPVLHIHKFSARGSVRRVWEQNSGRVNSRQRPPIIIRYLGWQSIRYILYPEQLTSGRSMQKTMAQATGEMAVCASNRK